MNSHIRDLLVRAEEEMIFVGPDHPSYDLLAGLVASVRDVWQEGYDHGRRGGAPDNPYRG
ncbi:hypothetical protein HER39_07380 [Arthrobacter deserti]|uniref:Uncharacterized protein n=1 Tax=Arthrobacter deserti TaxID=1742687 RepID=A0ABX1JPV2_9MICC|nr:hypothetical protein [Arthrobacter deserti]